jgi:hypothetical protein
MQNHMFQLQTTEYLVLEKSDGIRYLLIETACPDDFFLVDRKYGMQRVFPRFALPTLTPRTEA